MFQSCYLPRHWSRQGHIVRTNESRHVCTIRKWLLQHGNTVRSIVPSCSQVTGSVPLRCEFLWLVKSLQPTIPTGQWAKSNSSWQLFTWYSSCNFQQIVRWEGCHSGLDRIYNSSRGLSLALSVTRNQAHCKQHTVGGNSSVNWLTDGSPMAKHLTHTPRS